MTLSFLERIERDIRAASGVDAACLRAERASYLARLGEFDAAVNEISDVRSQNGVQPNAFVTAWLKFAEGITVQHRNMTPDASDGLKRARALARAIGDTRLFSLATAWLAYLDYTRVDLDSLQINLSEAISNLQPGNHGADSRISLTIALMLHVGESYSAAAGWYDRCRNKAVAIGDELMISAMMHNMAWARVADQRYRALSLGASEGVAAPIRLGPDSTANFDAIVGVKSLSSYLPLLKSQVHLLCNEYVEALALLTTYSGASSEEGLARLQSSFTADRAYCYARLGRLEEAVQAARSAIDALDESVQIDDRAAAYSRVAQTFELAGESKLSSFYEELASVAWSDFEHLRTRLLNVARSVPRIEFD